MGGIGVGLYEDIIVLNTNYLKPKKVRPNFGLGTFKFNFSRYGHTTHTYMNKILVVGGLT